MAITEYGLKNANELGIMPERLDILENLIQKFMTKDDMRQTIIVKVTRKGHIIFEGCYGTNTKPYGVKTDVIFPVASITKAIVGTLVMCLQEDGLIDVCELVCRYFPEFTGGGREIISVWNFLTHNSGLMDEEIYPDINEYVKNEFGLEKPEDGSPEEAWDEYHKAIHEKLGIAPDSKGRMSDARYLLSLKVPVHRGPNIEMRYCNYGYQRLKDLIEAVSGEHIDVIAHKRLLDPLGMKDTYWKMPENKWDRILGRGERCEGYPYINSPECHQNEGGSGGLKTTVDDMTNLGLMLLNGGVFGGKRVMSRRSIAEMMKNHNTDTLYMGVKSFASWGLGWNVKAGKKDDTGLLRSDSSIDHGGWWGTKFIIDPEEDLTAAIFTADYKVDHTWRNVTAPIVNVLYSALE